jgi:hypothetical protein
VTPVCPACRATIALGSHVCGRCGLAVRPTCANCGEPLTIGMAECWYCREPIEAALQPPPPPVVAPPPPPQPFAPLPRPVVRPVVPRRHRVSAGRVLMEGIVTAFLLTFGMLMLEAFIPKYTSTSPVAATLERRAFTGLGFAISHPSGWQVTETANGVTFRSGERAGGRSTRSFVVDPGQIAFKDVKEEGEHIDDGRFSDHVVLTSGAQTRGGKRAYTRVVAAEGLRFEQWWIDRGKVSLRIEFRSRGADDDAPAINTRIIDTLELL